MTTTTTKTENENESLIVYHEEAQVSGQLVASINCEHKRVVAALESSLEHAQKCGEYLVQAKRRVPHGGWQQWVEDHCDFSYPTARNYMRVYCLRGRLPNRNDISYRRAIRMLRQNPAKATTKKTAKKTAFTVTELFLNQAVQRYCPDVTWDNLLDLLKAIGVVVRRD